DLSEQHTDDGFKLIRIPDKPGTLMFTSTETPSPELNPGGTPPGLTLQPTVAATSIETGHPSSQSSSVPRSSSPVPPQVPASESVPRQIEAVNEGAAHDDHGRSDDTEHPPK